jgi:hypothetical protein
MRFRGADALQAIARSHWWCTPAIVWEKQSAKKFTLYSGSRFVKTLANTLLFLLAIAAAPLGSAQNPLGSNLKVKVEATELDQQTLLARLNANGAAHHLKFVLAEQGYDYRITFGTEQKPVSGINASAATTAVYDGGGKELFEFKREGRWTDSGATNATAKEIIKRLLKLKQ